jgi:hypothetical protein
MPRQWWPSLEAMRAVIEGAGPWPAASLQSNSTFIPLDVDKYDGLAVVVGYGQNRSGREGIGFDDFQEMGGEWQRLGGGSGSHAVDLRHELPETSVLHRRMGGSSGESLFDARRRFSHMIFVCGLDVASVKVHRRHEVRTADVSRGPGWLAVLWTPDDPATVRACTSDGTETFDWTSPQEAA